MRNLGIFAALSAIALTGCVVVDNSSDNIVAAPLVEDGASVETLPASELAELIAKGEVVLIDVRTPGEYESGRIANALNAPVQSFDAASIPRDATRETILYCRSSGRSGRAAEMLAEEWQTKVRHLEGGTLAWQDAELPLTPPTAE